MADILTQRDRINRNVERSRARAAQVKERFKADVKRAKTITVWISVTKYEEVQVTIKSKTELLAALDKDIWHGDKPNWIFEEDSRHMTISSTVL